MLSSPTILHAQASSASPVRLYRTGLEALEEARVYDAIEAFTDAVDRNPGYADAHMGLAQAYGRLGELDQAVRHAERARNLAPSSAEVINTLATLRVDLGELENARELYDQALEREPNNRTARLGLAELAVAQGNFTAAVQQYEAVRQGAPNDRRALLSLALLWEERGDGEVAERYIDLAVRYHSDDPQVHLQAARYYLRSGDAETARRHARVALQIRPTLSAARRLIAAVAYGQEDYEIARQAAEELLSEDERDETAWYLHALAQYRLGEIDAALRSYRTALRLVPDAEVIRLAYEDLLLEELPADDAARREAAVYHFDEGRYLESQNLFDRARAEYRRGLLLDPFSVDGRRAYAELFRFRGLNAKYVNELQVLTSLVEDVPRDVQDRIEVFSSVTENSVAAEWNVDQFTLTREPLTLALYVVSGEGVTERPEEQKILADALRRELLSSELLDVPRQAATVENFSGAFNDARNSEADYFMDLGFETSDRSITMTGTLYAARTGTEILRLRVSRSGGDRVGRGMIAFVNDFVARLPVAGTLLERRGSRLLLNLGRLHGVEADMELSIVRPENVLLSSDEAVYMFADGEVLGTATVSRVDDLVAEASLADPGLFDVVREGDRVVLAEDRQAPPGQAERFPVLYDRIRRTR
jgi:tetratricopeptide (TPR) repeat protein